MTMSLRGLPHCCFKCVFCILINIYIYKNSKTNCLDQLAGDLRWVVEIEASPIGRLAAAKHGQCGLNNKDTL